MFGTTMKLLLVLRGKQQKCIQCIWKALFVTPTNFNLTLDLAVNFIKECRHYTTNSQFA